ncbi:MAG: DUF58 domain-containing protein [Pseudomonadota bacterium]
MNQSREIRIDDKTTVSQSRLIEYFSQTRGLVFRKSIRSRSVLAGSHASRFRGRGMDFAESRVYQPGDDVNRIDWRVTARTGETHSKIFIEERERPVIVACEFSDSMYFGSRRCFKSVFASHIAAVLTWIAVHQGDRVGGLVTRSDHTIGIKPGSGKRSALKLIGQIVRFANAIPESYSSEQNQLSETLERIAATTHPGSMIVLIGDFYSVDDQSEMLMHKLQQHNDLVLIEVSDALELEPPDPGRYAITDGQDSIAIDTRSQQQRTQYQNIYRNKLQVLQDICQKQAVALLHMSTSSEPLAAIQPLLTTSGSGHSQALADSEINAAINTR